MKTEAIRRQGCGDKYGAKPIWEEIPGNYPRRDNLRLQFRYGPLYPRGGHCRCGHCRSIHCRRFISIHCSREISTCRGLLPSNGPTMPRSSIWSMMRAARA